MNDPLAPRRRPWLRWLLEGLMFLIALWAVGLFQTRHHLNSGDMPKSGRLVTLDGTPVSLEALRGQRAAITFWAPWCKVCAAESDNVSRTHRWLQNRAQVVSIAVGFESLQQVQEYMAQQNVDYPVWLGDEALREAWHVNQFPTTYFLDENGSIQGSVVGYTTTLGLWARTLWE